MNFIIKLFFYIVILQVFFSCQNSSQLEKNLVISLSDFPKTFELRGEKVGPPFQLAFPGAIIFAENHYYVVDDQLDTVLHKINSNDYSINNSFLERGGPEMSKLKSGVVLVPEYSNASELTCWLVSTNDVLSYHTHENGSIQLDSSFQLVLPFEINEFGNVAFLPNDRFIGSNHYNKNEKLRLTNIHAETLKTIEYNDIELEIFNSIEVSQRRRLLQGFSSYNNKHNRLVYASALFGYIELYDQDLNLLNKVQFDNPIEKNSRHLIENLEDPKLLFLDVKFEDNKIMVLYLGIQESKLTPTSKTQLLIFDIELNPLEVWNLDLFIYKFAFNEEKNEILGIYPISDRENLARFKAN